MKSLKTAVLGAIALAAGAALTNASTTTILYVNGSTAFRSVAVTAIHNSFTSLTYGYTGTSETGQDAGIYTGLIGGLSYTIVTTWTGSESGIQATADAASGASGTQVKFIHAAGPTAVTAGTNGAIALTAGGTQNLDDPTVQGESGTFDSINPSVTFSDTYQATGQYKAGATKTYVDSSHHTYIALTPATPTSGFDDSVDGIVGVIPFGYFATPGATFSNVTAEQVRNLYSNGKLPLSFFTGNNGDESTQVYAIGRNNDSGSRLTTMLVAGLGAVGTVKQYEPFGGNGDYIGQQSADTGPITSISLWALDTVNNIAQGQGNSGYNSGGKLATALKATNSVGGYLLGYVGPPVAQGSAVACTYEGVAYSDAVLKEGLYPIFSYEHLYYNASNFAAGDNVSNDETVIVGIANTIFTTCEVDGGSPNDIVEYDNMNVQRSASGDSDGSAIEPIGFSY